MTFSTSDCPNLVACVWEAPDCDAPMSFKRQFLDQVVNDERFDKICTRMPRSEIRGVRSVLDSKETDDNMIRFLVLNRIMHPLCNNCRYRSNIWLLKCCSDCEMTFYCSRKCQTEDWPKHRRWCCVASAEADDGPLNVRNALTVAKFKRDQHLRPSVDDEIQIQQMIENARAIRKS